MADGLRVSLDGASRLRRTLRQAGADMRDVTRVHREIGAAIVPLAKSTAPVGPDVGGHIGASIRATANQRSTTIKAGGVRQPYGPAIHWGWHRRNIRPNAWISRAAQQTEPRWTAIYAAGIERIIEQIKGA